jgi:kynurenine 3-monooxygenase
MAFGTNRDFCVKKVTIVGAGTGGLSLSLSLAMRGIQASVYDSRSDPTGKTHEVRPSNNITLSQRGLNVLTDLGLGPAVRELCLPIRGRIIHSVDGTLFTQPYSPQGHCLYCTSRVGLERLLIHAVRKTRTVKMYFQEECAFVDVPGGVIEFKNKRTGNLTRIDGGYVIGAEGSSSPIREALESSGRSAVETRVFPFGYKEIPLRLTAEAEETLSPEYLHVWARGEFFLIAFPNPNQSFTSLLFMSSVGALSLPSLNNKRTVEEFFESEFPDLYYSVPDLAVEFVKGQPRNLKTIRCYPWVDGKFALLGDAAHTILPFYGQGMNATLEDCAVLSQCLGRYDWDGEEPLIDYQRLRKSNADAIDELSSEHFSYLATYSTTYESIRRREIEAQLALRFPDEFVPVYPLVQFSDLPYLTCQKIAEVQAALVDSLLSFRGQIEWESQVVGTLVRDARATISRQRNALCAGPLKSSQSAGCHQPLGAKTA